ncbi:Coiled-coil domain-containing protein 42 [Merluccius polli]|uniref:Coiled-coil domain-containing protein 42 n=1 Tax=Merluccius polli TaxID=89951 RepID=A0AA47N2L9_MERPO|nr:Coiled-coil domain-containing protein 42 [Merluccius polli]
MKTNDVKRCRGVEKAEEERKKIHEKEDEICALKDEIKALRRRSAQLDRSVRKHAVYANYMKEVAQVRKQAPGQVMSCFATLTQSRTDLMPTALHNLDRVQNAHAELACYRQQATDVIVRHNNALEQLISEWDMIQAHRMMMESQWAHILDTSAKKTLQLGTVKMAILNLSQIVHTNEKSGDAPLDPEDTMKQLDQVGRVKY